MKIFPGQVNETQRDQHDGERIDGHQHWDRKLQNERETGIADHHADDRKYHGPAAVSELGKESGEIVRAAGNQTHAGIEACNEEDEPKEHLSRRAKKFVSDSRERLSTVFHPGECAARFCADLRERTVDHKENGRGNAAGKNRFLHDGAFALNAHRTNVHCNDETKIQRRQRIHRLIAVDEAMCKRSARISSSRRTGFTNGIDKGAEPEHADERNERGAEKFAQTARQLFRVQGY